MNPRPPPVTKTCTLLILARYSSSVYVANRWKPRSADRRPARSAAAPALRGLRYARSREGVAMSQELAERTDGGTLVRLLWSPEGGHRSPRGLRPAHRRGVHVAGPEGRRHAGIRPPAPVPPAGGPRITRTNTRPGTPPAGRRRRRGRQPLGRPPRSRRHLTLDPVAATDLRGPAKPARAGEKAPTEVEPVYQVLQTPGLWLNQAISPQRAPARAPAPAQPS